MAAVATAALNLDLALEALDDFEWEREHGTGASRLPTTPATIRRLVLMALRDHGRNSKEQLEQQAALDQEADTALHRAR